MGEYISGLDFLLLQRLAVTDCKSGTNQELKVVSV
jgi:hypothetical protein